ncbi:PAS fold-4 domain protein, partial [mine drainage metagenome]
MAGALVRGHVEEISDRICKDGRSLLTRTVLTPWRDPAGRTLGILSISRDVSEELRASPRLHDGLFYGPGTVESTTDSLFTTSLDGVIIDVNQEMERLAERPREE